MVIDEGPWTNGALRANMLHFGSPPIHLSRPSQGNNFCLTHLMRMCSFLPPQTLGVGQVSKGGGGLDMFV